ncbi:MAG: M48 family metallopeptidase, partial [Spirochaetota bacterium]
YEVYLLDNPQVNAIAVPGGGIFIFKGLLESALTDAELAGVLAHEISHVEFRHGVRQMIRFIGISFLFNLTGGMGVDLQGLDVLSNLSSLVVLFKYSRAFENDADANAVVLTEKAGYDPKGMASFLRRMGDAESGPRPPEYLSTHPATKERIAAIEKMIGR